VKVDSTPWRVLAQKAKTDHCRRMKNTILKISFLALLATVIFFASGQAVLAATSPQVQTNSASNIQNSSVTLNGNLTNLGQDSYTNVWFQWGITTSYGNETTHQTINYPETFSFSIYNLAPNTTFHFRAVAQNSYATVYGQDMTFTTGQTGNQQVTANAGPDLYVNSGQSITLQGSGYDNTGSSINYHWSCVGGTLSSSNIAQPTYNPPYTSGQGTYTCQLTVTNTYGYSNSDSCIVYVNYNQQQTGGANAQTNSATNVSNYQATLNGYFGAPYLNASANVWFQWGSSTSYGNNTLQQSLYNSGSFSQNITGLSANTTYHFRAAAQNNNTTIYGSDMTFYTGSGSGSGNLLVNKKVINLTSGNLNWQTSTNANPGDVLSFAITLQAQGQDVHNIFVQDVLPLNLIYKDNLLINASLNYASSNPVSGINVGVLPAGQVYIISYQVQVAPSANFVYGTSTLTSTVTVTSQESGTQTAIATVLVNNSSVQGATTISTGITNNFLEDSFFLPLLIILISFWLYFSGSAYKFADRIKTKL